MIIYISIIYSNIFFKFKGLGNPNYRYDTCKFCERTAIDNCTKCLAKLCLSHRFTKE